MKHMGTLSGGIFLLAALLLAAAYLSTSSSGLFSTTKTDPEVKTFNAPYGPYAFSVQTIDGRPIRLADYQGRVTLVNFWATWCAPCRLETPALVRMHKKYGDRGFSVIGIAVQSGEEEVREFVKEFSVPYAIAVDQDNAIASRYGLFAVPTSFLFSPQGKLLQAFTGYVREKDLEAKLQALLDHGGTGQAAAN